MKYNEMYRLAGEFESKTKNDLVAAALYSYIVDNSADSQLVADSQENLVDILAKDLVKISEGIISDPYRQGKINDIVDFLQKEISVLFYMTDSELSALDNKLSDRVLTVVTAEEKHRIQRAQLMARLKAKGLDEYCEYKAISVFDEKGMVNADNLTDIMNLMGLEGWRLKTAVTNEVGKNASSVGINGISVGTNSTVDQTVLIFERTIKVNIEE